MHATLAAVWRQGYLTSSEGLLPVFVTITPIVTFCPALMVVGITFKSEYLKVVYELQGRKQVKSIANRAYTYSPYPKGNRGTPSK